MIVAPGSQPPAPAKRSRLAPGPIRLVPAVLGGKPVALPLCFKCLGSLGYGSEAVGPLVPLLACADCGRPNLADKLLLGGLPSRTFFD